MSDFKEESGNMGGDMANNTGNNAGASAGNSSGNNIGKKPNTLKDILTGFGISAAAYAIIWLAGIGLPGSLMALTCLAVVGIFGFITVKFFRKGHTAAAIIMLTMISPALLAILLYGACAALGFPF